MWQVFATVYFGNRRILLQPDVGFHHFLLLTLDYSLSDHAPFASRQIRVELLSPRGVRGLAYWDTGFRVITANRPLHKLADFKGMKIRINSSKVNDATMRSVGAVPQTLAFSEVYQGLQTGVVDGADTVMYNALTQKFYEVQKHISLVHHSHQGYILVVNKKFWDALPADLRAALDSAAADACTYENALSVAEERNAVDKIKASGKSLIYELTPAERNEIKRAMMSVHRDMEARLGRDNIQSIYKATGFSPSKE